MKISKISLIGLSIISIHFGDGKTKCIRFVTKFKIKKGIKIKHKIWRYENQEAF